MTKHVLAVLAVSGLAACSGGNGTNPTTGGGTGGSSSNCSGSTVCTGEVNRFVYDAGSDTLQINNLPFDLTGLYVREPKFDRSVTRPGGVIDTYLGFINESGDEDYVALVRRSDSGDTEAAVIGTGGYLNFGYGGTVYRANGSTNMPNSGEAVYEGGYAGVRVYDVGGLGYSDGYVRLRVDFEDFDVTRAVDGTISNRRAYDSDGNFLGDLPFLSIATAELDGNLFTETPLI